MKNWILFTAITILTALTAWHQYQQEQTEQKHAQKKDLIFPEWKAGDIKKIRIQSDQKTIILARKGSRSWVLQKPFKDKADSGAVLQWIESVLAEKASPLKKEDTKEANTKKNTPKIPTPWGEYGLSPKDQPRLIELTSTHKQTQLFISRYSAFDGRFFLKQSQQVLLLGSRAWAQLTDHPANSFRNYNFFNHTNTRPLVLKYQDQNTHFSLQYKNHTWQWLNTKNKRFPLSQSEVEDYIVSLSHVQFQKQNVYPLAQKTQKKYGLLNPAFKLSMTFKDPKPKWTAHIAKKANKYYAWGEGRDYIFTLPTEQIDTIKLTEQKIRDHSWAFRFAVSTAHFIEIKQKTNHIQLTKQKTKWIRELKNASTSNLAPLEAETVKEALNNITRLRAKKYFLKHLNSKQLNRPYFIVIQNKNKETLLKLNFSKTHKKNLIYASTLKGPEVMSLPAEDINPILQALLPPLKIETKPPALEVKPPALGPKPSTLETKPQAQ